MSKMIRNAKKKIERMERGQVIVIVAIASVAIIAIVGLVMDVGIIFFGNARLRRAVDSAALGAALQYRENYTTDKLTRAANEFLQLNGILNPSSVVSNCDNTPGDPELCSETFKRKLVRVRATAEVELAFLPVLGINTATISAVATSETASLDVVLVIDRSESMTLGPDLGSQLDLDDPLRDPHYCNNQPDTDPTGGTHTGSCEPFNHVLTAAKDFTDILFLPYDHLAIVTFDSEGHVNLGLDENCPTNGDPCDAAHIRSDVIYPKLAGLKVFEGQAVGGPPASEDNAIYADHPSASPARCYDDRALGDMKCETEGGAQDRCTYQPVWAPASNYKGLTGKQIDACNTAATHNPSTYTTTNIGAGLLLAGNQFADDERQNSLWVMILLTDGVPNAGHTDDFVTYYCPVSTWYGKIVGGVLDPMWPRCNDGDADPATRHSGGSANSDYDALDYAYDMADFVGKAPPVGQQALIYTIGLGPEVNKYQQSYADPYSSPVAGATNEGLGKVFLNYAASDAVGHGQAFYAASPTDLLEIFRLIGTNIATRLSK
jgi:Flp pilus assembly protein TadG